MLNNKISGFVIAIQEPKDARHEDIPEISSPNRRFPVLEGGKVLKEMDKVLKEMDIGGQNVQPPHSEILERIRNQYDGKRVKIDKFLTLGYNTSGDPRKMGTRFPNLPNKPGITKKKVIRKPCNVVLIQRKFWFSGDIQSYVLINMILF